MMQRRPVETALAEILVRLEPPLLKDYVSPFRYSVPKPLEVKSLRNVVTGLWYDVLFGTSDSEKRPGIPIWLAAGAIFGILVAVLTNRVRLDLNSARPSPSSPSVRQTFESIDVRGQVIDARSKRPIPDAQVIVFDGDNLPQVITTNKRGVFYSALSVNEKSKAEVDQRKGLKENPSPLPLHTYRPVRIEVVAPGYETYVNIFVVDMNEYSPSQSFKIELAPPPSPAPTRRPKHSR
jgi:hypothetical protein